MFVRARRCRWTWLWLSLWAVAGLCCARAQAEEVRQERLVYRFDFEEREKGNFEDLPMHWFPIGREKKGDDPAFERLPVHRELMSRPGFPAYTEVRFDDRSHTSGNNSFYLGLNGGSAGAFLEAGTVAVVPNSDYLVKANVRTTVLAHARARLVAYFIDDKGQRIDESVAASDLIRTDNRWDTVSVRLQGDFSNAAWIGMEIQLLQPQEESESPLGKHQVIYQEVRGGAWFDDIAVWQLPRVSLATQSVVNIIRAPDRPRLQMEVRDLTGRPLRADITLYDPRMHVVAESHQSVGNGAPSSWKWSPDLPGYGWYMADMIVREPKDTPSASPVARVRSAFLWLEDAPALHVLDARSFGLNCEDLDDDELDLLPPLFDAVRLDAAVISCWGRQTTLANVESRQARLDQLLQTMLVRGREVTLSLAPVPQELARGVEVDSDSPLSLFQKPEKSWINYLGAILLRDGQRVRRWQLGTIRHPDAFFQADLPAILAMAQKEFQSLAPQPELVVPWQLSQPRRPDMPRGVSYAMDVPPSIRSRYLGAHMEEWQALSSGVDLRLTLREPPATEVEQQGRINDLIERMLYSWEAGATGLALDRPWTVCRERSTTLAPDPLLGVFSAVAQRLSGSRVVGRLPLQSGVECLILDGPSGGMLATWNRSAKPQEAVIDMFLGPAPIAIDAWGNAAPVPLVEGRHRLALGPTPIFIKGIDPALALFRATFRMTEPFVESTQGNHERSVVITNPWSRTISGFMLVTQPHEWQIEPRRSFFSIAAGQSTTIPLQMTFPVSEVAGRKGLVARFDFTADQHYVVDLSASLELGLKDVNFEADLAIEPNAQNGGRDAVVTQLITNSGNNVQAFYAFANMAGYPRQERVISRLKPGQSIIRRFRFPDAGDKEGVIHVGLRETSGPAVLNKIVNVPGK